MQVYNIELDYLLEIVLLGAGDASIRGDLKSNEK